MKIQYIKSACVLIEHQGIRVLCDPWLTDGIYYGSWYHYPPLAFKASDFESVDYLYLSHIHPDHLDPATLRQLPKSIPILILNYAEKYVLNLLKKLGFTTIHEIEHGEIFSLGDDFTFELFAADNCDPAVCGLYFQCAIPRPYKKTVQIDSMAVFKGGEKVVINTNDCPYPLSKTLCDRIASLHPVIDLLLLGYGGATAFPQCFDKLDARQKLHEGRLHRTMKLEQSICYLKHLRPSAFLPFAGQYTLGGKLAPLNAFTSPPHIEDLPGIFPPLLAQNDIVSRMILLNSGDEYAIDTRIEPPLFIPPDPLARERYIHDFLQKKKLDYEDDPGSDPESRIDLSERLAVARDKMLGHQKEHGELKKDCHLYLDAGQGYYYHVTLQEGQPVETVMPNALISPFLRIGLDYALLIRILDCKAHWNNAEIGSHLRFYRDPDIYRRSLHFFLSFFHC